MEVEAGTDNKPNHAYAVCYHLDSLSCTLLDSQIYSEDEQGLIFTPNEGLATHEPQ